MNLPTVQESPDQVRKSMLHLQRCLSALDKIRSATDHSQIYRLADDAIKNQAPVMGGTVIDG